MSESPLETYFPKVVAEVKGFAIFMMDKDAIIRTWNKGCELMKGYTAEEAIGQPFAILFPDFLREQNMPEKEVQITKETGRYETENWRRKKNGDLFWAHVLLSRVTDDQGNLTGYVKITQDHTDKKNYENQLKSKIDEVKDINLQLDNLNRELSRSNSSLEEFAYASSHDLQSPLRKINYFIAQLKKELGEQIEQKPKELFRRIDNSISRMARLMDDLLTFSYFSKGAGAVSEIDLNQQVNDVLEDLELEISEKGVKVTVEQLPTVKGNSRQLQQLFQNLISNAIKYSRSGVAPEIHISASEISGSQIADRLTANEFDKKFNLLQVADNGIGFEQEYAEDIFKVFVRLTDTADYPGTGVGLSIVQKVVENHDGYIWAESKPGEGSTFKVLLPVS